ncbi:TIGR04452 family lipoprotein [Leptospira jelokensis]|uniref:TIGR04452 family lipoprotein n=1 Tax=Leptospira jelokensis TaxID=2484931 RepID=UPI001090F85B|nr:TIGR04452 family lipoprotein [Leptospira jelokensis]TGM06583.1 TIGR04452 family lipoprotein [Leptospira jelokensis]
MLKKIVFLLLAISLTNCLVLNPAGASLDREKGSEAASRITDAAIRADLVRSVTLVGSPVISIFAIVAPDIAKIESDKYYIKSDVDQCVSDIAGFQGYVLGSLVANIISCQDISSDGYITGEPFPSF